MCKTVQYMIVVTCLGSVYTLVLMSLDRFLAVVHPISSMSIRTERNALMYVKWKPEYRKTIKWKTFPIFFSHCRATLLAWFFIFTTAIPTAICHGEVTYMHKGDNHTACLFLSEQGYNHSLFQVSQHRFTHKNFLFIQAVVAFAYAYNSLVTICLHLFLFERLMFAVEKKKNKLLPKHHKSCKTSCLQKTKIFPLHQNSSKWQRKTERRWWIHKAATPLSHICSSFEHYPVYISIKQTKQQVFNLLRPRFVLK